MTTHFSCEILAKPRGKIDLDEAHDIVQTIETWRNTLAFRSWPGGAGQLVILRDTFMRAAYASNRPHRKTRAAKPTSTPTEYTEQEDTDNG
jgi:hypothetical protein